MPGVSVPGGGKGGSVTGPGGTDGGCPGIGG